MNTNTEVNNETTKTAATGKGPGRPKAILKYPRGAFTFKELYELNRGEKGRGKRAKVCELTVRNHIASQVEVGFLTEIDPVETGKPGQPAKRYIRTAVKAAADAARAAKSTESTEAVVETPAEVPAETVEVPANGAEVSMVETMAPAADVVPV